MNLPSDSTGFLIGLAVRHLRLADVGFDAELALHAVDDDLQVQLAHAGNDGLARLFVGVHAERRVFLRQAIAAPCPSFPGRPWSSAPRPCEITGSGNTILSSMMAFSASQRVSPVMTSLQTDRRGDVAGAHFLDLLALVGVHLQRCGRCVPCCR